jgi:predicted O-methyltransferase YrrM
MMNVVRQSVLERLWRGHDPFAQFPRQLFAQDASGWNSDHRYLAEAIARYRPGIVVEIGVWKGGSVLTMARAMREARCEGVIVAVDTWLGSAEHWLDARMAEDLSPLHGYPQLYWKFMNNVLAEGLQDFVLPLPLDSNSAQAVLGALSLRPAVIHLDSAHDYTSVFLDLQRWWALLQPGGMMITDDYDASRLVWPDVARAVDDFRARVPHQEFAADPYKCRLVKPAG